MGERDKKKGSGREEKALADFKCQKDEKRVSSSTCRTLN
jgi:hypothetical protein